MSKKTHTFPLFSSKIRHFQFVTFAVTVIQDTRNVLCPYGWHLQVNYRLINYSESIPVGSLLESASDSDSESNEFKNV